MTKKIKYSDEQQHALIKRDVLDTVSLFVTAKTLSDDELQNILTVESGKLVKLGFDVDIVDAELMQYATAVQTIQSAMVRKLEDGNGAETIN